eukprot:PhM_4_TR10338/c0_g1_i1/m.36221
MLQRRWRDHIAHNNHVAPGLVAAPERGLLGPRQRAGRRRVAHLAVHVLHPDAGAERLEEVPHEHAEVDGDVRVEVECDLLAVELELAVQQLDLHAHLAALLLAHLKCVHLERADLAVQLANLLLRGDAEHATGLRLDAGHVHVDAVDARVLRGAVRLRHPRVHDEAAVDAAVALHDDVLPRRDGDGALVAAHALALELNERDRDGVRALGRHRGHRLLVVVVHLLLVVGLLHGRGEGRRVAVPRSGRRRRRRRLAVALTLVLAGAGLVRGLQTGHDGVQLAHEVLHLRGEGSAVGGVLGLGVDGPGHHHAHRGLLLLLRHGALGGLHVGSDAARGATERVREVPER